MSQVIQSLLIETVGQHISRRHISDQQQPVQAGRREELVLGEESLAHIQDGKSMNSNEIISRT